MVSMWPECFSYLIIYKLYENDIYHLIITHEVCLCVMIFFFFFFGLPAPTQSGVQRSYLAHRNGLDFLRFLSILNGWLLGIILNMVFMVVLL